VKIAELSNIPLKILVKSFEALFIDETSCFKSNEITQLDANPWQQKLDLTYYCTANFAELLVMLEKVVIFAA